MGNATSPRFALREATAAEHERVDAAFADFDLADRRSYANFLAAQAAALLPVEAGIDRSDVARLLPDWPERRRGSLLCDDLNALEVSALVGAPVDFDSDEAVLGAVYVLEGSRMGGRMLARAVAPNLPCRFLEASDDGRWRTLTALIDTALGSDEQRAVAIDAARAVFARFEQSARRQLECAGRE